MSIFKDQVEIEVQEAEIRAQKSFSTLPKWAKWFFVSGLISFLPLYFAAKFFDENIWLNNYRQNILAAHSSFSNPKPPITSDVTLVSQKANSYAAIFGITNPNLDLSLDQAPYEVDFYDAQKNLLYTYRDQFYLLPDQTKFLTVPTFSTTGNIAYSSIQLPDNLMWQKRLQVPQVNLVVSPPSMSQQQSPPAFVVSGYFTNQSPYTLSKVRLIFILYDNHGNIVGTSQRDELTIAPNQQRAYTQLWPDQSEASVARVSVKAYTDTLDSNNLTFSETASSSASSLSR